MKIEFAELVSFVLLIGFLSVVFVILLGDLLVFNEDPDHSEMGYLLVGALTGYVASIVNSIYKKK